MQRLGQLLRNTSIQLTLVYTLVFGLLAAGVVLYIGHNTGRLLIQQSQVAVDDEVQKIAEITRGVGLRRLIPMIESRSRQPGANLYLVADPNGRIIAGNVRDLDRSLLVKDGWKIPPFDYERFESVDDIPHKAIARVFTLPGNLRLLVGRDIGEFQRFQAIVQQASTVSLAVMVLTGLCVWFFIGRRALRHIDSVANTSQQIMAGDLSQRLPLSGTGDEFDRLSTSLNSMIGRLEKLDSGIQSMSDSIAHDLKTPLTRLRGQAERALASRTLKTTRDEIEGIISESDGIIKTFDALLMISKVEAGASTIDLKPVDLNRLIADLHELFEASFEEKDVALILDHQHLPPVNANRELIVQALINLLDNALKYGHAEQGAKTIIKSYQTDDHVVIDIADNGQGISKEEQKRVQERFVRLDNSRTLPGSGLGLSMVKAIASLHGGTLTLHDNSPGLICRFSLPL